MSVIIFRYCWNMYSYDNFCVCTGYLLFSVTKHARKRMMVNDGNETHMNEKGTNENGLNEQLKMVEPPNAKVTNEKENETNCIDKSISSDCDDRMTKDGENETAQFCQNVDDPSTKCQTEKTNKVEKLSDYVEEEIPPISRERLEALQLKKETLKEDLERSSKEIQVCDFIAYIHIHEAYFNISWSNIFIEY